MSKVPRPIARSRSRFFEDPSSVKNAVRLIIVVTVLAVLLGSLAIWVLDHRDFPDYGTALWFSLQTVTTVGYGDVTPTTVIGRLVAGVVMVTAIGFIAVFTAAVTSTFVEAARRRRGTADEAARRDADDRMHLRFDELSQRLDRIERRLGIDDEPPGAPSTDRPTS
jgi:voltage-gated potassium channel